MTCKCQSMDECIGCQNAEAEIERLRAGWKPDKNSLVEERLLDEAKAEIERLKATLTIYSKDTDVLLREKAALLAERDRLDKLRVELLSKNLVLRETVDRLRGIVYGGYKEGLP